MFVPIFTLNLNQKLLPGRISIGEFDGEHPCLVAATTGERVLIHNPHQRLKGVYFVYKGPLTLSLRLDIVLIQSVNLDKRETRAKTQGVDCF